MHRNHLKKLLIEYKSKIAEEVKFKSQMLNFLQANKDCFNRELTSGHFTASA